MNVSKPTLLWILVVIATLSAAGIVGYRSIHTSCCTEELDDAQLRQVSSEAQSGNVAAMMRLFYFYDERQDVSERKRGIPWLKRAADTGYAKAELFMYERLSASDDAKEKGLAIGYLRRAAEHGSSEAQEQLGELYRDGAGVSRNLELAEFWLGKSARLGDQDGVRALCDLILLHGNKAQCEECLRMDSRAMTSLDQQSAFAKELAHQRERIDRRLKHWDSGPQ